MRRRTSADCLASVPRSSKNELSAGQSSACPAMSVAVSLLQAFAKHLRGDAAIGRKIALRFARAKLEARRVTNAWHRLRVPQQHRHTALPQLSEDARFIAGGGDGIGKHNGRGQGQASDHAAYGPLQDRNDLTTHAA